jgi:hypothetical protein
LKTVRVRVRVKVLKTVRVRVRLLKTVRVRVRVRVLKTVRVSYLHSVRDTYPHFTNPTLNVASYVLPPRSSSLLQSETA